MRRVLLFGEDYAHEVVLQTLLERLAEEHALELEVHVRSARGGHGRMIQELKEFLDELRRGRDRMPDLFVVARDANCLGYSDRVKEIRTVAREYQGLLVFAVPDPHIERWLLLDPQAFKQVLGQGCQPPDQKCDRDRYKLLLERAVQATGVDPVLGGVEFAESLVRVLNLRRAEAADSSFGHLLRDLRKAFQGWHSC